MDKMNKNNQLSEDPQVWKSRLIRIVESHFSEAEARLPLFRSQELRSVKRIFWRNLKYTGHRFHRDDSEYHRYDYRRDFQKAIVSKTPDFF